jgi:peptidoglycan-associated lipoprotein
MKRIAVVLATLMVVACNTAPKNDAPQASQKAPDPVPTAEPVPTAGTDSNKSNSGDLANKMQSVYFDFGKATINPENRAIIQKQAESLKGHKENIVTLEGNCDERGSAEYNLGLGQRRADVVKKIMVTSGVSASQLKTTSQGKEKPKLSCHDESCWKENRRVDFVQGS